jgi:hypothetical protein
VIQQVLHHFKGSIGQAQPQPDPKADKPKRFTQSWWDAAKEAGRALATMGDVVGNASAPQPHWRTFLRNSHAKALQNATQANLSADSAPIANAGTSEGVANAKPAAEYNAKALDYTADKAKTIYNDDGGGGAGTGPSGPNSGSAVPASGPNIQGPNGRLGAVSPNPMLGKYAHGSGAWRKAKQEEDKEKLDNSLREVAQKYHGYLPNFKGHFTKKEVDAAKALLPATKVGAIKNGMRKTVRIPNGISKGKEVTFVYNERRDFAKDKNGRLTAEWVPPQMVDHTSDDVGK